MLAEDENFAGLARINRERIGRVEAIDSPEPVVLDMDSTEIPVYGEQEQSAYNGHFESNFRRSSCPEASGSPHSGPRRSGGTEKMIWALTRPLGGCTFEQFWIPKWKSRIMWPA